MFKTIAIATVAVFVNAVNVKEDDLIRDTRYISMNTDALFKQYDKPNKKTGERDAALNEKEFRKAYKGVMQLAGRRIPKGNLKAEAAATQAAINRDDDEKICQNEFRTWICNEVAGGAFTCESEDDDAAVKAVLRGYALK